MVLIFVHHVETNAHSKKQKGKAETLFSALNNSNTKARIFYLADLFEHVNQLNKTLQGRNTNLVDCAKKVRSFLNKFNLWKMHLQKNEFTFFCNLAKPAPSLEVQSNLGFRTQFVLEGCSKTDLFESRIIFSHYK